MKLFYATGACSLASHIILEEIGKPYEAVKIDLRAGEQKKPEYLAINWKGKVPALQLDDGQMLTENPAIMTWLAESNPKAGLLAAPGELERARALEWLSWCASGVQPSFGPLFGAAKFIDGDVEQNQLKEKAKANVEQTLATFDRHLQGKSFVLGDKFSIADSYTLVFYNWAKYLQLKTGPAHHAAVEKLLERPAVKRALEGSGAKVQL